jgi:peptide/nickel transport system substrate-binding protein
MRYGFLSEPTTFDPLSPGLSADGRSILFNVFEGLVKPDTEGRHQPALAESYTVEDGGRIYNFKLRPNVLFHDGSPLSPADVKFTLETAMATGLNGMDAIESVEISGENDVRLTLRQRDPDFLPFLTIGIVKDGSTDRDKTAIGTGPFSIEEHKVGQSLVLSRFADYWQKGVPVLEKVTIVFMSDHNALFLAMQGGSIDGAFFTGGIVQQFDPKSFDIVPVYSSMVQLLALNNAVPPFDDIRVRRAFNYAISRQEIIDAAFFGKGRPAGGPVIPGLTAYYDQSTEDDYPYDTQMAIDLLAEAGYGEGGEKLSVVITVPSNYTMHVDTAEVIVSQLARVGVNASINRVDWATWLSDAYQSRNYQATIVSVDGRTASPRSFLDRYRSDHHSNFVNFSNTDFDSIFDRALAETDEAKRIELYKEAQRIISDNAASVYIQDILGFHVFRAGAFGGVLEYPLAVTDFAAMYGR